MIHSFDVDVAMKLGVDCAVIFNHIGFWVSHNQDNDRNYMDGSYWTFNSAKALENAFPYMSYQKIGRALTKLEDAGLIKSGNYNKSKFDRTKWYALTDDGYRVFRNDNSHLSNLINGRIADDKPIPDINTDINTDINNLLISKDINCQTDVRRSIDRVVEAWNELEAYGYARITRMTTTSQRYKWLKARISEYGVDEVLKAISNVKNSKYLKDAPWFAFDWFVRPNNFPKVLEGKYNDKGDNDDVLIPTAAGGWET